MYPSRIFKWRKTFNVTFNYPPIDDPSVFFNRYIAPAMVALDNQYEHEKKKVPGVVRIGGLKSVISGIFEPKELLDTMVIYMEIGEVDEEATENKIRTFISTI